MRALTLVPLLAACGGSLSDEDIEAVFTDVYTVSTAVQAEVAASASTADPAKDLTFTGDQAGWTISGTMEDGATWTGTIEVDGTGTYSPTEQAFGLDLTYIGVSSSGSGLELDGTVSTDWTVSYSGTDYSMDYAISGDLDISGDASGTAEMDYSISVAVSGGQYSYTMSGDINGQDVSGYSMGGGAYAY